MAQPCCEPCEAEPFTCAICLDDERPADERTTLQCGHAFCTACLGALAARAGRTAALTCPLCSRPLVWTPQLIEALSPDPALVAAAPAPKAAAAPPATAAAERDFEWWARRHHIKLCPQCGVMIEKNGGCGNVRCRSCRAKFRWSDAPLACPCRGWHFSADALPGLPLRVSIPSVHPCAQVPRAARCHVYRRTMRAVGIAVALPVWLTAAAVLLPPAALAAAVESAVLAPRRRRMEDAQRGARARRSQAQWRRDGEAERAVRTQGCRSGDHPWVPFEHRGNPNGWCPECGALRQPIDA